MRIAKGKGIARAASCDFSLLPEDLDPADADNEIISVTLSEREANPNRKVIVVSRDINMRVKCDALGIQCEDYVDNKVVKTVEHVYSGFKTHLVDSQTVDQFYEGEEILFDKDEVDILKNQYVMLVSNSNDKKTALGRFCGYNKSLQKIVDYKLSLIHI